MFYDIKIDEFRVVTQADVDLFLDVAKRHGALLRAVRTALEASKPVAR